MHNDHTQTLQKLNKIIKHAMTEFTILNVINSELIKLNYHKKKKVNKAIGVLDLVRVISLKVVLKC